MSDFKPEHRYWVFKRKLLSPHVDSMFANYSRDFAYRHVKEAVVVEHDWPNYAHVWETVKRVAESAWEDPYQRISDLEARLAAAEAQVDGLQNHARRVQDKLAAAEVDAERWMDVSVDGYPAESCVVLIARHGKTVLGAFIAGCFWYQNEQVAVLFWRHLPKPPDPVGAAIDAARGVK